MSEQSNTSEDQNAIDDFAFHLFNVTRGVGMEQGSDLLLYIIYLRSPAHSSSANSWTSIRNAVAHGLMVPERLLVTCLNERLPRRQVSERDVADSGTGVISSVIHQIDAWPFEAHDDASVRTLCSKLFESVLRARTDRLSKTAVPETPRSVATLMARVAVRPGDRVLDPACGNGSTLAAAHEAGATALQGWDLSEKALIRAAMRFELSGIDSNWEQQDSMRAVEHKPPFDSILIHPPFSQKPPDFDIPRSLKSFGLPPTKSADLLWIQLAISMLDVGGRAAVLLPVGALYRSGPEAKIRKGLVNAGYVEAVIGLPGDVLPGTGIKSAVWLLKSPDHAENLDDPVVFVSGDGSSDRGSELHGLTSHGIDAIVDQVEAWRRNRAEFVSEPSFARAIEQGALGATTVLNPGSYLDSRDSEVPERPPAPAHLISSIKLGNVKSFGGEHEVELAPITLLYGPNSSGKSSLLQSLLLLKQSMGGRTLVTQGDLTDAGSFEGLVHRHETDRQLSVGLKFGSLASWSIDGSIPDPGVLRSVELTFRSDGSGIPYEQEVHYEFGDVHLTFQKGMLEISGSSKSFYYLDAGQLSGIYEAIADRDFIYPLPRDPAEDSDPEAAERRKSGRRSNGRRALRLLKDVGMQEIEVEAQGLLPGESFDDFEVKKYFAGRQGGREEGLLMSYLNRTLRVTRGASDEMRRLLSDMTYLGPLRSAPQRYYNRAAAAAGTGSAGENIALHLFDNSSEAEEVNEWLSRLGIPYSVDVMPVRAVGGTSVIGDSVAMVLTDTRSGVDVSPSDVGFGVSQVLPIVVELLANRETVICIEQPEIHLHPKVQTELAELLIQSASSGPRKNQVIVETHSEHLLLRLQRRIREGELLSTDVAVIYVEQDDSGNAGAQRLRMDDAGFFIDPWPAGFFDDSLDELFGGMD